MVGDVPSPSKGHFPDSSAGNLFQHPHYDGGFDGQRRKSTSLRIPEKWHWPKLILFGRMVPSILHVEIHAVGLKLGKGGVE